MPRLTRLGQGPDHRPGPVVTLAASHGVALVEALVAAVVLATGVLGAVMLGLSSAKTFRMLTYEARATELLSDMAERLRSNPDGLDAYAGPAEDNGCREIDGSLRFCTHAQFASQELFDWQRLINGALPSAASDIRLAADQGISRATISVSWQADGRRRLDTLEIRL